MAKLEDVRVGAIVAWVPEQNVVGIIVSLNDEIEDPRLEATIRWADGDGHTTWYYMDDDNIAVLTPGG